MKTAGCDVEAIAAKVGKSVSYVYQRLKVTRAQLGTLAGFTPSGGTFQAYFSTLRRSGFITEASNGDVEVTEAGMDHLGGDIPPPPTTTEEVLAMGPPGAPVRRVEDARGPRRVPSRGHARATQ
jgi:hypothetical protein